MLSLGGIAVTGIAGPAQIVERPARLNIGGEQRIEGRFIGRRDGAKAKNGHRRRDQRDDKAVLQGWPT